jgi:hypothetical protein
LGLFCEIVIEAERHSGLSDKSFLGILALYSANDLKLLELVKSFSFSLVKKPRISPALSAAEWDEFTRITNYEITALLSVKTKTQKLV